MSADSQPLAAQGEKKIALPRFGLLSLFYATAMIAGAIAMFGVMGIFWAAAVLGFWWWRIREINNQETRPNSKGGFSIVELLVVIAIIGILFGMLMPGVSSPRYVSSRVMLLNSMSRLVWRSTTMSRPMGTFLPPTSPMKMEIQCIVGAF